MAGEKGHFGDAALDALHDPQSGKGGLDNGACLTGHLADFKDFKNQVSCNYRFQCYEGNKDDGKIKRRLHTYVGRFPEARRETDVNISNPKDWLIRYCFSITKPQFGDWHIGGPYRRLRRRSFAGREWIEQGENFTRALWPYFNNAHHIIPKGTLRSAIDEYGAEVSNIIQQALLKAKYNVNHKLNMIFLPMDKRVGSVLRLPRHLERRALKSHPIYDEYVRGEMKYFDNTRVGLGDILDGYAEIAMNASEESQDPHEIPDAELDKAKLERLSRQLLDDILDWGKAGTGDSLDDETDTSA